MGTLSYPVTYGDWSGTINLNYTTAYDPEKNQTTITFKTCSAVYASRADYQTTTDTSITVVAGDNSGNSFTATLHTEGYGTGGTVTFTGTPSPASIPVQHAAGSGAKTVSLSAYTTAAVRPYSGSSLVYAGGSGAVSETSATAYTLSYQVGKGVVLTITRNGAALSSGDTIYYGDSLNISFSALTGYEVKSAVLNGVEITSPYTHEVTGSVDINIVTALLSSAWIYVNGTFKRYFINIYIQGAWRRYREKIFPGGGTEQQAICGQALCGTIKCGGDI